MTLVDDDIAEIVRDVWSSMLSLPVAVAPRAAGRTTGEVAAAIEVSGASDCVVSLETSPVGARAIAAAMFGMEEGDVTDAEVSDAVGELTNVIGGNIKSLLPGPSRLSLPTVTLGSQAPQRDTGAAALSEVTLASDGEPIVIAVWSRDPAELERIPTP